MVPFDPVWETKRLQAISVLCSRAAARRFAFIRNARSPASALASFINIRSSFSKELWVQKVHPEISIVGVGEGPEGVLVGGRGVLVRVGVLVGPGVLLAVGVRE